MRKYASKTVCHAMALLALSAVTSGCVKRMTPANEPPHAELSSVTTLRSVDVSADASRVQLTGDRSPTPRTGRGRRS
jgi:type IV pilus assembly protein PilQ